MTSPRARTPRLSSEDGFGITELVIAVAILAVGLLGVFVVFETAIASTFRAGVKTTASTIASAEMERVRALQWNSIGLDETDIAAVDSIYRGDTAWESAAADRVDVVACGGGDVPCTTMVPSRIRTGADDRNYRVDLYVTWQAVAGGEDLKRVEVVVRNENGGGGALARLDSSFEDDASAIPVVEEEEPPGNRPPRLANPGGRNNFQRRPLTLTLDGSDPDGDNLTYSVSGLPRGLRLDGATGDITGSPRRRGTSVVTATATDGEFSDTVIFTWTIHRRGGDLNLAELQPSSQSTTSNPYVAGRANDGNTNGDLGSGSVAATRNQTGAWWEVDLGGVQAIERVRIFNRTDCCGNRLANFYVMVSDTPFSGSLAANRAQSNYWEHISSSVGREVNINVNDSARYVRIRLGGRTFLTLAEVEVIAAE